MGDRRTTAEGPYRPPEVPAQMFDWQVDGAPVCGTTTRPEAAVSALADAITEAGAVTGVVRVRPVMVDGAARPYATVRVNPVSGEVRQERCRG